MKSFGLTRVAPTAHLHISSSTQSDAIGIAATIRKLQPQKKKKKCCCKWHICTSKSIFAAANVHSCNNFAFGAAKTGVIENFAAIKKYLQRRNRPPFPPPSEICRLRSCRQSRCFLHHMSLLQLQKFAARKSACCDKTSPTPTPFLQRKL